MKTNSRELRSIDLGRVDAESDLRLREYFVTTPYVAEAVRGWRSVFIGRKGSGKSALYQQLPHLYRTDGLTDLTVVSLTPDDQVWAAVKQYEERGMPSQSAYTNAWLYTLTANLAVAFSRSQRQWDGSAKPAVAALKRFVAENYGNGTIDLVGLVLKLIPGLAKLNFSAFGLSAEVQWKPEEKQVSLHVARSLQRLMHSVGFCLQNAGAVILLDHLDDSWDGSPEAHDMLVGLLKAAKRLNDLHPMSNDRRIGLKVIVFLRSDIYSRLHFDDNDKHRPLEEPLVWTDVELVDMIDKRLPGDMTVLDIVAEPRLEYMLERTFMRPREVIQFFGECFRVAPRSATELTLPDIIKAEEQYSRWKVADLRQEFARSFPDFGDLVECLRLGPDRYESYAELIVMIGNRKYRLVKDYGERAILETLFDASVLGYKASREDKAPTFRCDNDDLTLPGETTVFVHKGLHKGLNIQQRRSWRMSYGGMRSRS